MRLPGVQLAQGITEITGVAISPLLGVSSVGAWRYFRTPMEERDRLPWFCHPGVWGGGFLILAICFLKDAFGTVAPPLLKKPLDVIEVFENKASAVVASTAFVPLVTASFAPVESYASRLTPNAGPTLCLASAFPLPDFSWTPVILLVPPAILMFLTVWLACHAINILILLSPFGLVDALLKLLKAGLLVGVVGAYALNPYVGAGASLIIVVVAAWLAPWAFRLTVFGTLAAHDILLPERATRRATPRTPHAFLARTVDGVPVRTYGRLICSEDGVLSFTYRPWLILRRRSIQLPKGPVTISRGLFFPGLLICLSPDLPARPITTFLPRYRTFVEEIAAHLPFTPSLCDAGVLRGLRAVGSWLEGVFPKRGAENNQMN